MDQIGSESHKGFDDPPRMAPHQQIEPQVGIKSESNPRSVQEQPLQAAFGHLAGSWTSVNNQKRLVLPLRLGGQLPACVRDTVHLEV